MAFLMTMDARPLDHHIGYYIVMCNYQSLSIHPAVSCSRSLPLMLLREARSLILLAHPPHLHRSSCSTERGY